MDYIDLIERLKLEKHFEGGYYSSTHRSKNIVKNNKSEERNMYSVIYYMLTKDRPISKNHKLKSDEWWFWHNGGVLEMVVRDDKGNIIKKSRLGDSENCTFQSYIEKNYWQETRLIKGDYALVSCVVVPGFHINDFILEADKFD